jgi:hypothetical protein
MAINVFNPGPMNGQTWASLADLLTVDSNPANIYQHLAELNKKPIMLAEWASSEPGPNDPKGVTKGQWIIDAADALITQFRRIRAVVWFDEPNGSNQLQLDSSTDSLQAARRAFGGCSSSTRRHRSPPSY